jgi:hypothetical protein
MTDNAYNLTIAEESNQEMSKTKITSFYDNPGHGSS